MDFLKMRIKKIDILFTCGFTVIWISLIISRIQIIR